MLVSGMSYALVTQDMLWASMTACWAWPEGSIFVDPEALAAWLGLYMGVTPKWAHFILEPYTHCHTQGCYYSPIVQDAYNQLQVHQHPPLLTTRGMPTVSSFTPTVRLAARLSYPPGTSTQPPATPASSTAVLDIHWPLSHRCTLAPRLMGGHPSHATCHHPSPYGGGWWH